MERLYKNIIYTFFIKYFMLNGEELIINRINKIIMDKHILNIIIKIN